MTKQENIEKHGSEGREIMSVDQAAAYVGVHPNTLLKALSRREIRHQRIGTQIRIRRSWVLDWMESAPPTATEAWAAGQAASTSG